MKSSNDLSALADFGRKWIEEKKENDYKGAKYFWDKNKAKEFSEVEIDDLLFDEYFLDAESWLWSGLVDEIKDFWYEYKYGDKTIFCVIGGFGSGKTAAFGSIMTWLAWYDFTCKFDPESDIASPQEYYGLKPTSTIAFIALSKTVKKSKEITFSEIKPSFNSQFNKDYFPVNDRVKSQVQIPNNNTLIFPNTATEAANAGYSVYGYVMDEVSFLEEIEESSRAKGSTGDVYDQAAKSFESAEGRRYSRFKNDGIGVLISSVNYDEDFLVSMVRDIYLRPDEHKDKSYKILLPWKSRPSKYSMSDGYFYFDTEDYKIIEDPYKIAALERYYEEPDLESLIYEDKDFHKNYEYVKKAERGYYDFDEDELEKAKNFKSAK